MDGRCGKPTTMDATGHELVEVYRARSLPHAHALRLVLEEEGIHVQIEGEYLQGAVGDLPLGWPTTPRLLAPQDQVGRALEIIRREEERERAQPDEGRPEEPSRCLECGAVMSATETKCPSCGWTFQSESEPAPSDAAPAAEQNREQAAESRTKSWLRRLAFLVLFVGVAGSLAAILYMRYDRSIETKLHRARMALYRDDFDEVISRCTDMIEAHRNNAPAYFLRGQAYEYKQDYKSALADYDAVIGLVSPNSYVYLHRAYVHLMLRDFDRCIADCDYVIQVSPNESKAYGYRGDAYYRQGKIDQAMADYSKEIQFNSSSLEGHARLAQCYARKGDYEKAVNNFQVAIRIDPAFDEALRDLAWLRATCPDVKFRNGEEAVRLARKACEVTEWKDRECLDALAAAYAENGDFDQAIEWEKKAIELSALPQDSRNWESWRSKARERLKLYQQHKPYRDK